MPRKGTKGGAIQLRVGEGHFPKLSASQAVEIARGLSTRGDVIEHVADEARVSGVAVGSKPFQARVNRVLSAMAKLQKAAKVKAAKAKAAALVARAKIKEARARAKAKSKAKSKAKAK